MTSKRVLVGVVFASLILSTSPAAASTTYDLSRAEAKAAAYNYVVVQRDAHPGAPVNVLGWTDHSIGDVRVDKPSR